MCQDRCVGSRQTELVLGQQYPNVPSGRVIDELARLLVVSRTPPEDAESVAYCMLPLLLDDRIALWMWAPLYCNEPTDASLGSICGGQPLVNIQEHEAR